MSSFMCSPETLYVISDYLFTLRRLEAMKKNGIIKKDPLSVERIDLFSLLYDMNKRAIRARYGERAVLELINYEMLDGFYQARREYGEKEELIPDMILFYKISCFLYQCAEGDIDHSPLYNFVLEARSQLAVDIVHGSKEYLDISIDEWN